MFLVALVALVVGLADKAAAAEIGWCVAGLYGVFAGANSAITIGRQGEASVRPPRRGGAAGLAESSPGTGPAGPQKRSVGAVDRAVRVATLSAERELI